MKFRYLRALLFDLVALGTRAGRPFTALVLTALIAVGLLLAAQSAVLPAAFSGFP